MDRFSVYFRCLARETGACPLIQLKWIEVINTKDHGHPHVHVLAPGAQAKIRIDTLEVMENRGFTEKALRKVVNFMEQTQETLQEKWNEIQEDQN